MPDAGLGEVEPVFEQLRPGQDDEDARLQDPVRRQQVLQRRQTHRDAVLRGNGLRRWRIPGDGCESNVIEVTCDS